MKKVLLSLAFVLAISSSAVNASSSDEIVSTTSTENTEIVEDFGCASDCVSTAKEGALAFAVDHDDRSPGGELMTYYNMFYLSCYDANCR